MRNEFQPCVVNSDPSVSTPLFSSSERAEIQPRLEEEYHPDLTRGDRIGLAVRALAAESDTALSPETVDVATIDTDSEQYELLEDDALAAYFEDNSTADEDGI